MSVATCSCKGAISTKLVEFSWNFCDLSECSRGDWLGTSYNSICWESLDNSGNYSTFDVGFSAGILFSDSFLIYSQTSYYLFSGTLGASLKICLPFCSSVLDLISSQFGSFLLRIFSSDTYSLFLLA